MLPFLLYIANNCDNKNISRSFFTIIYGIPNKEKTTIFNCLIGIRCLLNNSVAIVLALRYANGCNFNFVVNNLVNL
jgi:hypothetical protein